MTSPSHTRATDSSRRHRHRISFARRYGAHFAIGLSLLAGVAACTPEIGDSCKISTDCSVRGDRLCDTSQYLGYCTQLNCGGNGCADEASCVLFGSALPGCGFNDRSGPGGSRVARSFCMAKCESNGDCRDGYVCADPRTFPWNAVILDDNQAKKSCLSIPAEGQDAAAVGPLASLVPAPICNAVSFDAGVIEASAPSIDGGGPAPLFPPVSDAGLADADAADGGG